MHFLFKSITMNFEDAVAATREALKRRHLAILAEIDLRKISKRELAVDSRPYLILSAFSPPLAHQAIKLDRETGSILIFNVTIQERGDGRVEIGAADPLATIGTINHVGLLWIAQELQSVVQHVIDDIEPLPKFRRSFRSESRADRSCESLPRSIQPQP
jgi:uncharacterized protein (DUF302 family)